LTSLGVAPRASAAKGVSEKWRCHNFLPQQFYCRSTSYAFLAASSLPSGGGAKDEGSRKPLFEIKRLSHRLKALRMKIRIRIPIRTLAPRGFSAGLGHQKRSKQFYCRSASYA
jgi:hypothetical protein